MKGDDTDIGGHAARFPTTLLSAIAGPKSGDATQRKRALDALVAAYWKPVYKYVRVKWRLSNEDAKDITQSFFERSARKDTFSGFDPKKARFRTFLRHCLDQFVMNERKSEVRLKRGGRAAHWSLDFEAAEAEIEQSDLERHQPLDDYFDREWYRSILADAVAQLRASCERDGKLEHFAVFERHDLSDEDEPPTYAAIAAELSIPPTTVTNRLSYARRELRRIALGLLATVTATEEELDSEARQLFGGR